ncbi:NGG1p interacting factor 3 protein, NIF3 [Flavobacterium psychrophilum]|jgi:dinuclear metal center YbgI/SA1388 family protein|uniref:GTP cyclohydrolase 1 type 2 homolog n=4 Tax=Flavobacterium psychrophilum TaxID=96345 RepID=A6GYX9_FLAPJ|nr:Nif3-like dinuclear metal center hexameric protein [Flavobacterium psychrophilum]AIG30011.1 NGG1p interacting factor 3 protein, NIF3 [Flavobacterium psychrophilum]AIG32287.1 NGG1p interacting factor 3 protein, NIF3 [Flavobacterium psychrophilum]AIG34445.1 NGG1p interacting factor 3 protein, NIF3 [Flavobacterium psychrophilum]AIG36805.1 NGG1p interacting factor 3 protein, NIF3 [Flavobacterium psychrophilum]AIG39069.1 NGG1p interacting factor 3 protein, NIF3 [Flavobacterium psychrophilum]
MKIKEILSLLEEIAPLAYAEDFDNVGLLVGDSNNQATGVLVCHDALEIVIDEAIAKKCNLIVCFHPILFSGLKKITGKNYVERAVIKAIKNDIAIYAVHTALDNHQQGVNKIICNTLGIKDTQVLIPKQNFIQKLVTYTIPENADTIRTAMQQAGAGAIGNYNNCSFNSEGFSTYQGNENSNPLVGNKGELTKTNEIKIEVIFEKHLQNKILTALFATHIYEEVAYEIYNLQNSHQNIGLGMVGELETEMTEKDFLGFVKTKMQCGGIRHSTFLNKKIKKVAVLGGAGSFAIKNAIMAGADAFLTADLKYHQFYEAENQLLLADIGHFESERYTKNYIFDYLTKKNINFAPDSAFGGIILSEENTNPVKYL